MKNVPCAPQRVGSQNIMQDNAITEEAFSSQREKMHTELLSSVSHDLKTPLAAVIGSLEIHERMATMLGPEKSKQLIATALMEAYRLDNFVTNILDMAKLDNGLVKMRKELCDAGALLRDSSEKATHRHKGINIKILSTSTEMRKINTDPALFSRLIGLLLDNAAKHAAGKDVELKVRQDEDHSIIQVIDGGPGIPDGRQEEIFFKYTRIKYQDRQHAGTGLGLAIARGLATLLGGKLTASNRTGGGAVFTFELRD